MCTFVFFNDKGVCEEVWDIAAEGGSSNIRRNHKTLPEDGLGPEHLPNGKVQGSNYWMCFNRTSLLSLKMLNI